MFHKIISVFLALTILSSNLSNLIVIGNFILNQDIIAKTLCIQKEEQKGCNGKCQLTKKLVEKNINSDSQKAPLPVTSKYRLDIFIANAKLSLLHILKPFQRKNKSYFATDFNILDQYYEIETPPPILV